MTVTKRTEAQDSPQAEFFFGVEMEEGGSLGPSPPSPSRRLEFLGASVTCGYGIHALGNSPGCQDPEGRVEDNWLAFGPLVSRHFGGECKEVDSYPGLFLPQLMLILSHGAGYAW